MIKTLIIVWLCVILGLVNNYTWFIPAGVFLILFFVEYWKNNSGFINKYKFK